MTEPAYPGIEDDEEPAFDEVDIESWQPGLAGLSAAEVMSVPVVTVSVRDTLWDAWSLLYHSGLRHLVVVDGKRCVGVIDDRRIALAWPLGPTRDPVRRLGSLVTGRTRCVLADATVRDLARIMVRNRVDVLPVVTSAGGVVGLVTASDLLMVLAFQPRGH